LTTVRSTRWRSRARWAVKQDADLEAMPLTACMPGGRIQSLVDPSRSNVPAAINAIKLSLAERLMARPCAQGTAKIALGGPSAHRYDRGVPDPRWPPLEHPAPPLLTPEHLAMMDAGVSVIASSCGPDLAPSVMRAVGSLIGAQGRLVTVYLCRSQSAQLLRDVALGGRLAVVFSQPSTHKTVQLKTRAARLREARESDVPVLQRYRISMERELTLLGFGPVFARAMLAHRLDDVVAIEFEPEQAFDQTPGSKAGQPIAGSA
jgi:hypothetical protein